MKKTKYLLVLFLVGCFSTVEAADFDAFELMKEVEQRLNAEYWPGYNPRKIPVAVFDGGKTLLFNHAAPPADFTPVGGHEGVYAFAGQHAQVKGNTAIDIGGVTTATFLLAMFENRSVRDAASVVFHECFHVWQKEHFPSRWPNAAHLFTYPRDDARLLLLRRQETEALRRSFAEEHRSESESWFALALSLKIKRMEELDRNSREWERGVELIEGTAKYVESAVAGHPLPDLPKSGFPAKQVRMRPYVVGHAWAIWLDRLAPDWKQKLKETEPPYLDLILSSKRSELPEMARFTKEELDKMTAIAKQDVEILINAKQTARTAFLGRDGWTVIINCPVNTPFMPQGFDPMNVTMLDQGKVLHNRWLRLGNRSGSIEVNGLGALTEPAGEHPLFNGVVQVTVTGLSKQPEFKLEGDTVSLDLEGVTFSLAGAKWKSEGRKITLNFE